MSGVTFTSTKKVACHETAHALACGVAVALLHDEAAYAERSLHVYIDEGVGECGMLPLDVQAAALCAVGPVGLADDPIGVMQRGDEAMAEHLSAPDLELAAQWDGPPLMPTIVALAVKDLREKQLGEGSYIKLSNVLRDYSDQRLEAMIPLSSVCPRPKAVAAIRAARAVLEDFYDPPLPKNAANWMTPAQLRGRRYDDRT